MESDSILLFLYVIVYQLNYMYGLARLQLTGNDKIINGVDSKYGVLSRLRVYGKREIQNDRCLSITLSYASCTLM